MLYSDVVDVQRHTH